MMMMIMMMMMMIDDDDDDDDDDGDDNVVVTFNAQIAKLCCKMKAMIVDMCILSHKTQCLLMLGHVVGVGAGKLRGFTVYLPT